MPIDPPALSTALSWAVLGLFVGSFLNVCIHRLPLEDETIHHPRRSRCPSCRATLSWKENVPVLSWLVLRGRCKHCAWRIPARYPLVELGNAGLWFWTVHQAGPANWPLWVLWSVALSGLLVATMVDIDHFEIPDQISIGGMFLAPVACLLVPAVHADTSLALLLSASDAVGVDRLGALVGGLAGMAVGGGILYAVGWVGTRAYGTEAMGFGDVKLLAAGGGLLGPGGVLVALMMAAFTASVFGIANMVRYLCLSRSRAQRRGRRDPVGRSVRIARTAGRYLPFGPFLALGIGIALLHWNDVMALRP